MFCKKYPDIKNNPATYNLSYGIPPMPNVDNDLLLCQFWDGSTTQKYYIKVTDHDAPSLSPQYKFTGEFYQANNKNDFLKYNCNLYILYFSKYSWKLLRL